MFKDTSDGLPHERSLGKRGLHYPYGAFLIEEYDGHSMWPGGDPVPNSDETLVYVLSRSNVKDLYDSV